MTFANGTIKLDGSGNDNVLNQSGDVIDGRSVLTATGLGMVYIGPSGTATFSAVAAPPQLGQANIAAGTSGNVTMNPGTPVSVTLQGKLGTGAYTSTLLVTTGQPISLQVSLPDIAGNLTPLGSSSLGLTFAGAPLTGGTPPNPTVTDNSNTPLEFGQTTTLDFSTGQSAVTGGGANGLLTLYQVGTYTITATGSSVLTPPDGGLVVTVTPGPLAQLDLQLATPQVNGQQFTGSNTLTMRDAFGNELTDRENSGGNVVFTVPTSMTSTITFAGSEDDNQLETKDFSGGVANLGTPSPPFEGITYTGLAGLATIQAQAGAVTGTAVVTITHGPFAQLDLQLASPQTNTLEFTGTNTLTVRDVSGNPVTDWNTGGSDAVFSVLPPTSGSVGFAGGGGSDHLSASVFVNGVATLGAGGAGLIYTGEATTATIQSQVGSITDTADVDINAGPLTQLDLQLTSPQTNTLPFTGTNTLTLRDVSGNILTDRTPSDPNVVFTSSTGLITFTTSSSVSNHLIPADFSSGTVALGTGGMGMVYDGSGGSVVIQAEADVVTKTATITINSP